MNTDPKHWVLLRFPGLHNTERFKNVVFSSSLPPCWECARGCRYASPVCTIQRGLKMLSFHIHCRLAQHLLGGDAALPQSAKYKGLRMSSFHIHCRLAQHVLGGAATLPRSAKYKGLRMSSFHLHCRLPSSMCSGVPPRFPGLHNTERFKNAVFSSLLRPCSACAQECCYASPVWKILRGLKMLSFHLHCSLARHVLGAATLPQSAQ